MSKAWFLSDSAEAALADIYIYTETTWGSMQAESYVSGIFDKFEAIALRLTPWRSIAPELEVDGFFTRYQRHYIFWRKFDNGQIGIAAILHDAMLQGDRLKVAFGELPSD